MVAPEDWQLSTFEPYLETRFAVYDGDEHRLHVDLIRAERPASARPDAARPFSLVFRGPMEPILQQQIYRLECKGLAEPLDLFLVPIGPDASGMRYEAVFN
jgi:hypothetical protein